MKKCHDTHTRIHFPKFASVLTSPANDILSPKTTITILTATTDNYPENTSIRNIAE